ncbi:MAG: hypothetical protein P8X73_16605 [Ignavibacteriaceae bacterium]
MIKKLNSKDEVNTEIYGVEKFSLLSFNSFNEANFKKAESIPYM